MEEPRNLARHIRACHARGQTPSIGAADAKMWYLAVLALVRQGALEEATFAAGHLASTFPDSLYIGQQATLLKAMPPAVEDATFARFIDEDEAPMQVVRRDGATTLLLAFCGVHGALGMPLPIAHRWFGLMGMHVAYLRDTAASGVFEAGIPALAADRGSTQRVLATLAGTLHATRIVCYGNSSGAYAALLYGLEMGAANVLALNLALITAEGVEGQLASRVALSPPQSDLPALYAEASMRPRVRLVYARDNAKDRASALALSGIPRVTIEAVEDCSAHDAHVRLMEQGRFGALLKDALLG